MTRTEYRVTGARRLGLVLALVLAVILGSTTSAGAAPAREPRCAPAGGRTLAKSRQVRILARKGKFYSCWLPTRRRTFLGFRGELIPDRFPVLATHVRIDGEYVAYVLQATGDPGYDVSEVLSVNARTGRTRDVEPHETENFDSQVEDVGVAADGALVYLQAEGTPCPGQHTLSNDETQPDDAVIMVARGARRTTLDCELQSEPAGSISKLRVVGQTATWMHAGVLHTATLP